MNNPHLHNSHLPGAPFFWQGDRPDAVLLLHGLTATCNEVHYLGRALHQAGYTVRAPLLAGHGLQPDVLKRTTRHDWLAGVAVACQELEQHLDQAGRGGRLIVGGESTGGLLALALGEQNARISALLTYAPAVQMRFGWRERLMLRLFAGVLPPVPKRDLAHSTTWQGYRVNPPRAVRELTRLQAEVLPRLPALRAPLLIIQGRRDQTIDPLGAELLYRQAGSPVKALHWLDESPHCLLLEHEQGEAARLTLAFLAEALP